MVLYPNLDNYCYCRDENTDSEMLALTTTHAVSLTMRHSNQSKWKIIFEKNKEWISFRPQPGFSVFPCYACRSMFSQKLSFVDHINRRVVTIKYNCPDCSTVLTFYNRCSFILHARSHFTNTDTRIKLANVEIDELPVNLAGFTPIDEVPLLFTEEEDQVPENVVVNNQFYTSNENDIGKSIITMKPYNLVFYYTDVGLVRTRLVLRQICKNIPHCQFVTAESEEARLNVSRTVVKQEPVEIQMPVISKIESLNGVNQCPECHKEIDGPLEHHFTGPNNKPTMNAKLICPTCNLLLVTDCALQAHERVHKSSAPYICPECGIETHNSETLLKHLDESCFHFVKQLRYKCPVAKCGKLFVAHKTFLAHLGSHYQFSVVCNFCGYVSETRDQLTLHTSQVHNMPDTEALVCNICGLNDVLRNDWDEHTKAHSANAELCVYIYACKNCKGHFRSFTTYATHRMKCVKPTEKPAMQNGKCVHCGYTMFFMEKDLFRTCLSCRRGNYNPVTLNLDELTKKELKEKEIKEKDSAEIRAVNNEKNVPKFYSCVLCKEQVNGTQIEHLKTCKYNNPVVEMEREERAEKRVADTKGEDDTVKKKKKRKSGSSVRPKKVVEEDPQIENIVSIEGMYICRLCNFKQIDRADFQKHLVTHRNVSTAFQCMECGECFVVKPSLVKHLRHYHNVSNMDFYFEMNDCFNKTAVEELENNLKFSPGEYKGPLKPNQCRVCFKEFENGSTLETHFRNHGLAFLMQKTK